MNERNIQKCKYLYAHANIECKSAPNSIIIIMTMMMMMMKMVEIEITKTSWTRRGTGNQRKNLWGPG